MSKLAHSDDASMADIETQEIIRRERLKIKVRHVYPPIPDRRFDWSAWFDGQEEGLRGEGPTAVLAIQDLIEQFLDDQQ